LPTNLGLPASATMGAPARTCGAPRRGRRFCLRSGPRARAAPCPAQILRRRALTERRCEDQRRDSAMPRVHELFRERSGAAQSTRLGAENSSSAAPKPRPWPARDQRRLGRIAGIRLRVQPVQVGPRPGLAVVPGPARAARPAPAARRARGPLVESGQGSFGVTHDASRFATRVAPPARTARWPPPPLRARMPLPPSTRRVELERTLHPGDRRVARAIGALKSARTARD